MSNPTVIEHTPTESVLFSQLDTHSTTDGSYHKSDFRSVSLYLVRKQHARILAIYKYISEHGGHNLTEQSKRCRTEAWVVQHEETKHIRIASRKCNQRWCPMCSKTKRWIITNSVAAWARTARHPKFLTFTLKSSPSPLEVQVSRLYDAFRDLRKRAWWKRKVSGGVWFFQLTVNKSTGLWHPHIHVLIDGDYIAKEFLSREWLQLTCDSKIIDIRKVHDPEQAAEYVARYATTPGDLLKCTIAQGSAMIIGLKGRRMCGSFGTAKGIALRPQPSPDHGQWRKVMSYFSMVIGSQFDDYIAQIQEAYQGNKPFDTELWGLYDTPDMPESSLKYKPESAAQLLFEFDECYFCTGVC